MNEENKHLVLCPSCQAKYRISDRLLGRKVICKMCDTQFRLGQSDVQGPDQNLAAQTAGGAIRGRSDEIAEDDSYMILGRMALKYKFLELQQLREALAYQERQERRGKRLRLGDILVIQGMLSESQLDFLLSLQEMRELRKLDRRFGVLAVKNGFATQEQIHDALATQERLFKETKARTTLGDILVASGILTERKRKAILYKQNRIEESQQEPAPPHTPRGETESVEENKRLDLQVSEDGLSAFVIPRDMEPLDVQEVKRFLDAQGIVFGIIDDALLAEALGDRSLPGQPIPVAKGQPPHPGKDARIEYHFDTGAATAKHQDLDLLEGKALDEKPLVQPGELLAEKIPLQPGQPGCNVYGQPIATADPCDITLLPGPGARLSEDGGKIFAADPGLPERLSLGRVAVVPILKIDGDVDAGTGHIAFDGAVHVAGTIKSGWRVTGASVNAGEMYRATVEAAGNIVVRGGVIGSRIKGGGNIRAKYVRESDIRGLGDLTVEKEIMDSQIEISGACHIPKGAILSSQVAAKRGIGARDIGSEVSRRSTLLIGVDVHVQKEIAKLREGMAQHQTKLEQIESQLQQVRLKSEQIQRDIGETAQIQDRAMVNQRGLQNQLQQLEAAADPSATEATEAQLSQVSSEIKQREGLLESLFDEQDQNAEEEAKLRGATREVTAEIQKLEDEILKMTEWASTEPALPEVIVTGCIFPDTEIEGRHASLKIIEPVQNVRIRERRVPGPGDSLEWKLAILRPR